MICNSQVNTSSSKQLFTFPKDERFKQSSPYCSNASYDLPSEFRNRNSNVQVPTTFGVMRPELFYCKEKLARPSPDRYSLTSEFDTKGLKRLSKSQQSHYSTCTFGTGRESYNKVVSHLGYNYEVHDPAKPGPGWYQPKLNS